MAERKKRFGMGRCQRIPEGLEDSLEDLYGQAHITRVILGVFHHCSNKFRKGHLKYQYNTSSGIKLHGYTPSSVIEVFVSIDPLDKRNEVIDYISKNYPR